MLTPTNLVHADTDTLPSVSNYRDGASLATV
jgi:hypothetical protein